MDISLVLSVLIFGMIGGLVIGVILIGRNRSRRQAEKLQLQAARSAQSQRALSVFADYLQEAGLTQASVEIVAQPGTDGLISLKAIDSQKRVIAWGEYSHGDILLNFLRW